MNIQEGWHIPTLFAPGRLCSVSNYPPIPERTKKVGPFRRNGWYLSNGIRWDFQTEWVGTFVRNGVGPCSGIRTWENGYVESFNGKLRDELLNREIFDTLLEVRVLLERWRWEYNWIRPHSSLGYKPPAPEAILSKKVTIGVVH